jgi:uncharacterized membrane protein YfcA
VNEIVFAACAIAFAAMVQSLSGFGFGMTLMGLLPLVLPVTEAVPIVALLGFLVAGSVLFAHRRSLRRGAVLPPLVGALIGVPLGVAFLTGSEPALLRVTLGVVLIVFAVHGLLGRAPVPAAETDHAGWRDAVGGAAGIAGGALGGAFNVGGPPLIVYVTWRGLRPDVMKATLQCCFLVGSCVQLPLFVHHGIVTRDAVVSAGAGVPAMGLGLAAGFLLSRRISRVAFRRLVLLLLLALGIWFLVP